MKKKFLFITTSVLLVIIGLGAYLIWWFTDGVPDYRTDPMGYSYVNAVVVDANENILVFRQEHIVYPTPDPNFTERITQTHINDDTLIRDHRGFPIDISELTPGTRVRLCLGAAVYQQVWYKQDDPNYRGYEETYYACYEIRLQE